MHPHAEIGILLGIFSDFSDHKFLISADKWDLFCFVIQNRGGFQGAKSNLPIFLTKALREGLKKNTYFYPHFVDKRFTPPPLIHVGGFYNNIIKGTEEFLHCLFKSGAFHL